MNLAFLWSLGPKSICPEKEKSYYLQRKKAPPDDLFAGKGVRIRGPPGDPHPPPAREDRLQPEAEGPIVSGAPLGRIRSPRLALT